LIQQFNEVKMTEKEINEILLYQYIGRGILLFNDLTARLCGIKIFNQKNASVYSHEMTEMFDKIYGKQDFINLCKGSNIVDPVSAGNLYDMRNDIIHSCSRGIGFEQLPELAKVGVTENTLIRFKYGEDKDKKKDPNMIMVAKIDIEDLKEFTEICDKYIGKCINYFNEAKNKI